MVSSCSIHAEFILKLTVSEVDCGPRTMYTHTGNSRDSHPQQVRALDRRYELLGCRWGKLDRTNNILFGMIGPDVPNTGKRSSEAALCHRAGRSLQGVRRSRKDRTGGAAQAELFLAPSHPV